MLEGDLPLVLYKLHPWLLLLGEDEERIEEGFLGILEVQVMRELEGMLIFKGEVNILGLS